MQAQSLNEDKIKDVKDEGKELIQSLLEPKRTDL